MALILNFEKRLIILLSSKFDLYDCNTQKLFCQAKNGSYAAVFILIKLVIDKLVVLVVPAVKSADFLADLFKLMLRCIAAHCSEMNLTACR